MNHTSEQVGFSLLHILFRRNRVRKIQCTFILPALLSGLNFLYGQNAPAVQWEKSYGGSDDEVFYSLETTTDHSFLLIGDTKSEDGDVHDPPPGMNSWIAKIDSAGDLQWEQSIGGSEDDHSYSGQESSGHGYLIGVESLSSDGDANENFGGYDFLCTKLDQSGNVIWTNNYGGSSHDHPSCVHETKDGGCIMCGGSRSNDGQVIGHHGSTNGFDVWMMKLDSSGNIAWSKSIGGSAGDFGLNVQQTFDRNYIVVGEAESDDGDISGHHGIALNNDLLVMKIDSMGSILWQKCYGGSKEDVGFYVKQTADSSYIIVGSTASSDGDVTYNHGGDDFWVLSLQSNGELKWQRTYGGSQADVARSVQPVPDGYVITGETFSSDGDVSSNHGASDYWVIKIDLSGNLKWQETLGGSSSDFAKTIRQLPDKSFIIGGTSFSDDSDVTGHHGSITYGDYWIVKLDSEENQVSTQTADVFPDALNPLVSITAYPSPSSNLVIVQVTTNTRINGTIQLQDLTGNILLDESVNYLTGKHEQALDLSNYPPGLYILNLQIGKRNFFTKIEKQ